MVIPNEKKTVIDICDRSPVRTFTFLFDIRVTRFGKILPLWPKENNLWYPLYGLFSVWQHFDPTLVKRYVVFAPIFIVVNGKILKIIWSHCLALNIIEKCHPHILTSLDFSNNLKAKCLERWTPRFTESVVNLQT